MKAVRFEHQTLSLVDLPQPVVRQDEALIKILLAGICATDLAIFEGYADFNGIPGHEFVGMVKQCPNRPDLVGKRVVADINVGCGQCSTCLCQGQRHCPERKTVGIRDRDGAFAEYCAVPASNLYEVPESVETICAVFAEPLAAALEISEQVHIGHRTRIAVIGDGKLGLLTALALRHYSGEVVLAGRHPQKLALAKHQGVATACIDQGEPAESVVARLDRFDMTVDATGHPEGVNLAIALTRPKGIVMVKTTAPKPSRIDLAAVTVNELQLFGSRCGDLAFALRFLENRWIDVMPLVEAVYPLARFQEAFSHALRRESLKVMLAVE